MNKDEKQFQSYIVCYLKNNNNYNKRDNADFSVNDRMCKSDFMEFIKNTQYDTLHKISYNDTEAFDRLIKLIRMEIAERSLLSVIKDGVNITDICKNIDKQDNTRYMIYPVACPNEVNKQLKSICNQNIMSVIPEFRYCNNGIEKDNRIDLAILINGFPIVAIELKLRSSGSSYKDAINQWKNDRSPTYDLLKSKTGFIVYFAMDDFECHMATKLLKNETYFLPFNQGSNGAGKEGSSGNPVVEGKYSTCYIWENILKQENLLDIIYNYTYEITEDSTVNQNDTKVIFPRYHQYDCVDKMQKSIRNNGIGKNYLAQHSTGSGKSNSIAWLALRLSNMQDENNKPLFKTVIVVVDRVVLIKQLFDNIRSFNDSKAIVFPKDSNELKEYIEGRQECKIAVTTIQKFGRIDNYDFKNKSKFNYAIIADEAHSGETGKNQQKLIDGIGEDTDGLERFKKLTDVENVSLFAFTATPSKEVINIFGTFKENHKEPFHIYSMKQAVAEGFIIDVLGKDNFYLKDMFYHLKVLSGGEQEIDGNVERILKKAISEDANSNKIIAKEVVNDFLNQIISNPIKCKSNLATNQNNYKCRGMVVCSSRTHAYIMYSQMIDELEHIRNNDTTEEKVKEFIDGIVPIIAFSGKLRMNEYGHIENYEKGENDKDDANILSEESLNEKYFKHHNVSINGKKIEKISERDTARVFKSINYAILIVANKFQTGFDDKYLNCMYVIKPMQDRNIVQTYSRLNRACNTPSETESKCPRIIDYVNDADKIAKAYSKYYTATKLNGEFDISNLFENYRVIKDSRIITTFEIELLSKEYESDTPNEEMVHYIGATIKRRLDKLHEYYTDELEHRKESLIKITEILKPEDSKALNIKGNIADSIVDESDELNKKIRKYIKDYCYALKFIDMASRIPENSDISIRDMSKMYEALSLIANIIKTYTQSELQDIKIEVDNVKINQNGSQNIKQLLDKVSEYVESQGGQSSEPPDNAKITVAEWVELYNGMYNATIDIEKVLDECEKLVSEFKVQVGSDLNSSSSDFETKLSDFIKNWSTNLGIKLALEKITHEKVDGDLAKMRRTYNTDELKDEFNSKIYAILNIIMLSLENKINT